MRIEITVPPAADINPLKILLVCGEIKPIQFFYGVVDTPKISISSDATKRHSAKVKSAILDACKVISTAHDTSVFLTLGTLFIEVLPNGNTTTIGN